MRIIAKILATLLVVPLALLVAAGVLMLLNGGYHGSLPRGQAMMGASISMMLGVVWLLAIWLPGIARRWWAALAGGVVMLLVTVLFKAAGEWLVMYQPAIAGGIRTIGPLLALFMAVHVMRRPRFAH